MIPVDLTVSDPEKGNCLQASIASLFELKIEAVPNFNLSTEIGVDWERVVAGFVWAMGYNWISDGDPKKTKEIKKDQTIGGFTEACVPSKNFTGKYHSVVIDSEGNVVHDPSPKKNYQGINIIETKDIISWMIFEKIPD